MEDLDGDLIAEIDGDVVKCLLESQIEVYYRGIVDVNIGEVFTGYLNGSLSSKKHEHFNCD